MAIFSLRRILFQLVLGRRKIDRVMAANLDTNALLATKLMKASREKEMKFPKHKKKRKRDEIVAPQTEVEHQGTKALKGVSEVVMGVGKNQADYNNEYVDLSQHFLDGNLPPSTSYVGETTQNVQCIPSAPLGTSETHFTMNKKLPLPAGADRPISQLSTVEKNKCINQSFQMMFSEEDDKVLRPLGKAEVDQMFESWLDLSVRMRAMATQFYETSAEDVEKVKAEVKALKKQKSDLRSRVQDLDVKAEQVKNLNSQLVDAFKYMLKLENDHAKALDQLKKEKVDLEIKLKEKEIEMTQLKENYIRRLQSFDEMMNNFHDPRWAEVELYKTRDALIANWKTTDEAREFLANVRVEASKIMVASFEQRMRSAIEAVCSDKRGEIEAEYERLKKEEEEKVRATLALSFIEK